MVKLSALEVLCLPTTATPLEITARWRELLHQHHPDKGGSSSEFMAVNAAYKEAYVTALETPCPECEGTGHRASCGGFLTLKLVCSECDGSGRKY